MGIFGFGRSYSLNDLQNEITSLENFYKQAMSGHCSKNDLIRQFNKVINICDRGNFNGSETVKWLGSYTSLRNVTPDVEMVIRLM